MTMKSLPFLINPARENLVEIGDNICGTIHLPRYDDITPAEKMFIDEEIKELPDTEALLIQLVNTIAKETGTSVSEVWGKVRANDTNFLLEGDTEGLILLRKVQEDVRSLKRLIYAIAMLKFRCPECKDWTKEDIANPQIVPPRMLRHLEEFCLKEMNRGQMPLGDVDAEGDIDESELKKIEAEPVTTKTKTVKAAA
jgi:hypothetical protein